MLTSLALAQLAQDRPAWHQDVERLAYEERVEVMRAAASYGSASPEVTASIDRALRGLSHPDIEERERNLQELARLGRPAHERIREASLRDPEAKARLEDLRSRLRRVYDIIDSRGLDHDVEYLLRAAKAPEASEPALRRREQILPGDATRIGPDLWWLLYGARARWSEEEDRWRLD